VPWNAPVALFIRSLGPALAAGNTVAAKLPGQTALTNALIADVISQARSLPVGVVNMFTESGNTGAPFLIESANVDMVSFTGSIEVGRLIAAAGAKTLKRMNLELGGKTPMIVFDDAALASTVPILAAGVTTFAGQNCMAGSRILVQSGIADQMREHLGERLTRVVVGPGEERTPRWAP
jgi:betaine-aldehyde dehydrogenase